MLHGVNRGTCGYNQHPGGQDEYRYSDVSMLGVRGQDLRTAQPNGRGCLPDRCQVSEPNVMPITLHSDQRRNRSTAASTQKMQFTQKRSRRNPLFGTRTPRIRPLQTPREQHNSRDHQSRITPLGRRELRFPTPNPENPLIL